MSLYPHLITEFKDYESSVKREPMVLDVQRTLYVDVDETLVLTKYDASSLEEGELITVEINDMKFNLLPNWHHVEQMRQFRARGMGIVVWSAGGPMWANEVVKAMGIGYLVDAVLGKPDWYIDDQDASKWMGKRFYLKPDGTRE